MKIKVFDLQSPDLALDLSTTPVEADRVELIEEAKVLLGEKGSIVVRKSLDGGFVIEAKTTGAQLVVVPITSRKIKVEVL